MSADRVRAELEAIRDEYRDLRDEIKARVARQEQLTHLSVILAGAMLTAFGVSVSQPAAAAVLLAFPLMYCIVIWLILRHDVIVYTAAVYIFTVLRPRVNTLIGLEPRDSVWTWDRFLYRSHLTIGKWRAILYRSLAFVRYAIPFILSVVSIVLFLQLKPSGDDEILGWERGALWVSLSLMAVTLLLLIVWVLQSHSALEDEDEEESGVGSADA